MMLAGIPQLHSNPSAAAKLFLDFDGNVESNWSDYSNVTTPPYDRDGDPSTFSDAETAAMTEIWSRVAEDYAPFKIDVTTVDPGNRTDKITAAIAIGGSYSDWYGTNAGGVAFVGGFYSTSPNVAFVFENNLGNGDPKYCGEAASHEAGHLFGLHHQSVWSNGNLINEYNPGNSAWAPIMGNSYGAPRTTWYNGLTSLDPDIFQDNLAILSNANNGFGYKSDDFGSTRATAAALPVVGSSVNFAGLIGRYDDQDYWSFTSPAGLLSLQLNVAQFGANLDSVLELQDSSGNVLVTSSPSDSQAASISTTVSAGNYYLVARSLGDYGNMGQYTITGSLPSAATAPEITVTLGGTSLTDGQAASFGASLVGAPVVQTFTVINDGTATLTLANPASLPAGFSLFAGLGSTTLAAGASTTFSVRLDAATAGVFSGAIALSNNDADENPFDLNLSGTVYAPGVTVSPTSVTATEGGTTGSYTVVLTSPPTANVTITTGTGSQATTNLSSLTFTSANWNVPQTVTVTAVDDSVYEGNHSATITHTAASADATYNGLAVANAVVQIADNDPPTLTIGALTPTASGFTVAFSGAIATADLNLYDAQAGTLGPADLTLVGSATGPVKGSLIAAAGNQQFTFVRTGGPLAPDTYTVVLRSAANGFHNASGALLDGDANGLAGGDYTTTFTVTAGPANEVALSVPDFARGYGQAVNLPLNTTAGIPITISTGQNVSSVDFDLAFDPALLSVTGFTTAIAGATATFTAVSPGLVRVSVSSASAFSNTAESLELGRLIATVPTTAPYASKAVLDLTNVTIKDGVTPRPARVDDGLQVAAFAGDANGNGTYSGGDTTLHQRYIVGSGSGFTSYQLLDPAIVSDINQSGTSTAGDTTLLQRLGVGMPIDQAPELPTGITPPAAVGPDPRLYIPKDLTGLQGQTITVPVNLQVTEPAGISVSSIDLVLEFDTTRFTASNFRVGGLLAGAPSAFSAPVTYSPATNTVAVTFFSVNGPNLAFGADGAVLLFDLTVNPGAPNGVTPINLRLNTPGAPTITGLANNNVDDLVLIPAPTNASNDSVDGAFRIGPPPGVILTPASGLTTTEAGGTATFTATLNSQPTADVVIPLSSSNASEGTVGPSSLTFTSANWNVPQTVTITGVNDFLDDGDLAYSIITAAAVSTDPSYSGLDAADVSVTNTDDDTQGLVISTATVSVNEGGTNTFTVRLAAQPTGDTTVTVARTAGDTDVSVSGGGSLTFTSGDWNVPQTVTLAAAEDADAVNGSATITVSSAGLTSQLVTATENDNDSEITVTLGATGLTDGQTVAFGTAVQGTPITQTFTVTNDGAAPLNLANIASVPTGFTLVNNFGQTTLNAGQSTTFTIRLDASVPGAKSGAISFANNDADENPFDLTLTGTVTAPEITVTLGAANLTDGQTVAFGSAVQGTPITQIFTVKNDGDTPLTLANIASVPTGFTLVNNLGSLTLAPNATTTFEIRLDASVLGSKSGAISFANNDADENPFDLTLTGTVTAPEISVTLGASNLIDGQTVAFGTAVQGTPVTQTFTVTNIGTSALSLTNIASVPTGFTLVNNLGSSQLDPGAFTTFQVRLDATVPGDKSGSISFSNSDLDENPFDLTLTGTVIARAVIVTPTTGLSATEGGVQPSYTLVLNTAPTADVTISINGGTQLSTSPPSVTFTTANWNIPQTVTVTAVDDPVYEGDHAGVVAHSAASTDAGYNGLAISSVTVQITDNDPPTLVVSSFAATASGFNFALNRAISVADLNLYDAQAGTLGPVDVTLVGATTGAVRGSLIAAVGNQQFVFVQTGGPLAPDTYTVVFRSATDGFKDTLGALLDGDSNGLAGGNYTTSFSVTAGPANEVTLSIPDFARGFGQAVNLPVNTTAGIPITLSTGQNVTSVDFDLVYNPALLQITGFTTSIGGAAAAFNVVSPGLVRVTVSSATQFSSTAGSLELGRLAATVPDTAPYASKAVLDLTNVSIENVAIPQPARVDDGVMVAAFVGDANGNGTYSGGDTTLLQRYVVGSGTGFTAFQLLDPAIVGDINRTGLASGGDTTLLQRLVVGMPVTEAPVIPVGLTPPPAGGPDPQLYIPRDLQGLPGQTITVPVMLKVTDPAGISVGSIDLVLGLDSALFTASNFRVGSLLAGSPSPFSTPVTFAPAANTITVTMFSIDGPQLAAGAEGPILLFDLTINSQAPAGAAPLNLQLDTPGAPARVEVTNNSVLDLLLVPAPTNAADDPIDGLIQIGSPDQTSPTADIVDVAPDPRNLPVGAVTIHFSEAVQGLDLADFRLTREGDPVSLVGLQLSGTGTDYTLDLSPITAARGTYSLTLVAAGSGIADLDGNPLSADASDQWRMNPWHNFAEPLNVDLQPGVAPLDALVVFNELNNPSLSNPATGELPAAIAQNPSPHYDVNDDGFVTALDALLIINDINSQSEGEGEAAAVAMAAATVNPSASGTLFSTSLATEHLVARQQRFASPAASTTPAKPEPKSLAEFGPKSLLSDALLALLASDQSHWPQFKRLRQRS